MKYAALVAALSLVGVALPASADTQVVAGNGLTLTEAAQIKFNRDTRPDDRHFMVTPVTPSGDYSQLAASFGMRPDDAEGLSLADVFVAKINHDEGANEQQLMRGSSAGMATRSPGATADHTQLAASAGLTDADAAGLSLAEIAAVKFANGAAND